MGDNIHSLVLSLRVSELSLEPLQLSRRIGDVGNQKEVHIVADLPIQTNDFQFLARDPPGIIPIPPEGLPLGGTQIVVQGDGDALFELELLGGVKLMIRKALVIAQGEHNIAADAAEPVDDELGDEVVGLDAFGPLVVRGQIPRHQHQLHVGDVLLYEFQRLVQQDDRWVALMVPEVPRRLRRVRREAVLQVAADYIVAGVAHALLVLQVQVDIRYLQDPGLHA